MKLYYKKENNKIYNINSDEDKTTNKRWLLSTQKKEHYTIKLKGFARRMEYAASYPSDRLPDHAGTR